MSANVFIEPAHGLWAHMPCGYANLSARLSDLKKGGPITLDPLNMWEKDLMFSGKFSTLDLSTKVEISDEGALIGMVRIGYFPCTEKSF